MNTTTSHNPREARAVLLETGEEFATVTFRETDYRTKLRVLKPVNAEVGKRVKGTIRAEARRIDPIGTGGAYIDPVYGRPTRIAGRVAESNAGDGTITVLTPAPFVVKVPHTQSAADFKAGDFVTMNLMPGASFTPKA